MREKEVRELRQVQQETQFGWERRCVRGEGAGLIPGACRVREEVSQGSNEQKVSLALRNSFSKASLIALSSSRKNFKVHVLLPQRCPMPVL